MDFVERVRIIEQDHEPDGWPAIQTHELRAAADEIRELREKLQRITGVAKVIYADAWKANGEDWLVEAQDFNNLMSACGIPAHPKEEA